LSTAQLLSQEVFQAVSFGPLAAKADLSITIFVVTMVVDQIVVHDRLIIRFP
jgi:hypothetical protein